MKNNNFKKRTTKGYTIIETMVSLSIFSVIILSGMAALLNTNILYHKSQDMRSVLDSLSFIMEDMSRNLRTGYNYRCVIGDFSNSEANTPQSCSTGGGIIFETDVGDPSTIADQWAYKVESTDNGATFNISKSTDGGTTFVQLNSSEVRINKISGFSVLGAVPPTADSQQPLVIIKLSGTVTFKNVVSPFSLQTSVSQRRVDI